MIDRTSLRLSGTLLLVGQVLYVVVTLFHAAPEEIVASELKEFQMPYVVGIVLSLGVALFARAVGFDREQRIAPVH